MCVAELAERHAGDVGGDQQGREAVSGPDVGEDVAHEHRLRHLETWGVEGLGPQVFGAVGVLEFAALVQGDERGVGREAVGQRFELSGRHWVLFCDLFGVFPKVGQFLLSSGV